MCMCNEHGCYLQSNYVFVGYLWLLNYFLCIYVCVYSCVCMQVCVCVLTTSSDAGSYTTCSCNLNHDICTNQTCNTELRCHRYIEMDYITNATKKNDQSCPTHLADEANCGVISRHNATFVSFWICCRGTDYCNTDDTAIYDFLRDNKLGVYMIMCLHVCIYMCVTVINSRVEQLMEVGD